MTVAIVDYGMGNVRSVLNALDYVGAEPVLTADPRAIDDASHIVLPGVGAFGDAMENLRKRGLIEILASQVIENGKPFLGICLGMQLLAQSSTEHGLHAGLGWFDAQVVRFDFHEMEVGGLQLKIPHMGWNNVEPQGDHPLFARIPPRQLDFYFVHSFHMQCADARDIAATCHYGKTFTAAIHKENIFATQFHPEKSQDNGLQMLENFLAWKPGLASLPRAAA